MIARRARWVALGCFALLSGRLLWRAFRLRGEVPFWDQWDFLDPLFRGGGIGELFLRQHGPHRQGVGGALYGVLYPLSGWNTALESMLAAALVIATAALALLVAKRIFGGLTAWDAAVPLCVLTGLQADAYLTQSNLAHSAVPVLLIVLAALLLTDAAPRASPAKPAPPVEREALRTGGLLAVDFLAFFTGFGFVLALPLRLLWLMSPRRNALALAASVVTPALFFARYSFEPAVDCFSFPHPRPWEYAPYFGLLLARPFGVTGVQGLRVLLVVAAAALLVGTAVLAFRRSLGGGEPKWNVAFLLAGTTMVFAALTTVGRVCLGLGTAPSPRYAPYVVPGLLAAYFAVRAEAPRLLPVLLIVLVAKELAIGLRPLKEVEQIRGGKERWRECIVRLGDVEQCQRVFAIYPAPAWTDLQRKVDWLRERRLNAFR